ncbi:LGFP repeat-containing protein, partial [Geodermatophilus sp. SYSU D00710]
GWGVVTPFQVGDIYWTRNTGAHVVRGEIRAAYRRAGASGGFLGYPITSEAGAAGGGAFVDFEYGSLYWSSATGVKVVRGEILKAYRAAGGPGVLGYPTADEGPTADGWGVVTPFQVGDIYWTRNTGAHVVRGEIRAAYRRAGASGGFLGYPITSDEVAPGGQGRMTSFAGGTIYWSAATGAHVLRTELNAAYLAAGGTTGSLGYPVSDTSVIAGQQRADFQYGTLTAP